MSFRLKPLYFERDNPVCTRSTSSFCRNPLNSCAHFMWIKWWYHAKFQPILSSGCSAFQFQGHLAQNKSLNAWKIAMKSERVEIFVCGFEWCILNAKKSWVEISLEKSKFLCNRWVFIWNPCTLKEMVEFVHEVHPVFFVILSTFAHMLCGSNDDTMTSFNLFWFQVVVLSNLKVI